MAFDVTKSDSLRGFKFELSLTDRSGKIQNFYAYDKEAVKAMQDAMLECALETQAVAYARCAFRTGFMRDHLEVFTSPSLQTFEVGWRAEDFFAAGFAFYPMFVVLGTRFMAPNDPLTPAYAETKPLYEQRVARAIKEATERRRK